LQGAFHVTGRTVDVDTVAGGPIEAPGASLLDVSISGASLFFGAGASFDDASGTINTANTVGFSASGVDAELALVKPVPASAGGVPGRRSRGRARARQAGAGKRGRSDELPRPPGVGVGRRAPDVRRPARLDLEREGRGERRSRRHGRRFPQPPRLDDGARVE